MNSDMALSAAERLIFCSKTLHSHHHTCSILHTGTRTSNNESCQSMQENSEGNRYKTM